MDSLFAIIVAGGRGMRMGHEVPKQFIPLGTRPVLMHTLKRFYKFNPRLTLILVLPEDQMEYWKSLCQKYGFNLPHQLVKGGETRFHSVQNGLALVEKGLVAIHDGVRPFVSMETIARCFSTAKTHGAAIPVTHLIESLRLVDGTQSKALPRESYRAVQTPQVFKTEIIKKAYNQDYKPSFTDDASVAEMAGYEIALVEGNRENIKITSPFDLVIANSLLKQHNN